jgi:very-short-patch-repair endonuclease
MPHPDGTVARLAAAQHGVVTRTQALRAGFGRNAIQYRLATGRWQHLHRNVYAIGGTPASYERAVLAAVLAVGRPGVASHRTAGALWGFLDRPGPPADVLVERRRAPAIRGVVVHRTSLLVASDLTVIGAIPVTTPTRTLIDLAAVLDETTLEEILDESVRRRLVTPANVLRRIERLPGRGSRGIGDLRSLARDRMRTGTSDSRLETRLRRLLRSARLPSPVPQFQVRDNAGRVIARVDFAYPDKKLVIETDGYAFHSGRRRWQADRARHNRLTTAGWTVCYFTDEDLRERPGDVVEQVRRAMR